MGKIEYFQRYENPVSVQNVKTKIEDDALYKLMSDQDKKIIEDEWNKVIAESPGAFSKPSGLGCLYDTQNGVFTFNPTEFKHYVSISRTSESRPLSSILYDRMRIGAVGAFLELIDGNIFVHRRSEKATHAAGFLDSSCAGLVHIENQNMNLEKWLMKKINKELGLEREEVEILGVTGFHSSYEPDFSAMFDFAIRTKLERAEIERRIHPESYSGYHFIDKKQIANYIIDHFSLKKDMIGDGAATLLGMLNKDDFYEAVSQINRHEKLIEFGKVVNGIFVPAREH